MPLVSVIMTTYNSERFVKEAVDSILQQTFNDYEFIIADDGSVDSTIHILSSYNTKKMQLFTLPHRGRAITLNYACKKASGEYLAFMDSDDISFPTRLEKQSNYLKNNRHIGLISSWYYRITENGKIKRLVRLPSEHDAIERMMFKHCSLIFPATMLRTEVYEIIGGFCEELQSAIDYDFYMKSIYLTKVSNINEPLLYYRQHPFSITASAYMNNPTIVYNILTKTLQRNEIFKSKNYRSKYFSYYAMCEYYYGSISKARVYCKHAFLEKDYTSVFIYIRSLLGDKLIHLFRNIEKYSKKVLCVLIQYFGKSIKTSKKQ